MRTSFSMTKFSTLTTKVISHLGTLFHNQLIRFFIVGSINTLFGYSVYAIFITFNFNPVKSLIIATFMGVLFNFKSLGIFVFNNSDNKLIYKFIILYINLLLLNILLLKGINIFLHNYYLTGMISILICSIISFITNKHFIFQPKSD